MGNKTNKIIIRKSETKDKEIIKELIQLCFGNRNDKKVCEDLNRKYWLCFKNEKPVVLSDLIWNNKLQTLEINWTCTHPNYKNKGYMQKIFTNMFDNINEDVYCSY